MGDIITRTGYCDRCFKEARPRESNVVLLYGTDTNNFIVHDANRSSKWKGFVPMIYRVEKVIHTKVIAWRACSIYGCGVYMEQTKAGEWYSVRTEAWERFIYSYEEWSALVNFKDHSYYI